MFLFYYYCGDYVHWNSYVLVHFQMISVTLNVISMKKFKYNVSTKSTLFYFSNKFAK